MQLKEIIFVLNISAWSVLYFVVQKNVSVCDRNDIEKVDKNPFWLIGLKLYICAVKWVALKITCLRKMAVVTKSISGAIMFFYYYDLLKAYSPQLQYPQLKFESLGTYKTKISAKFKEKISTLFYLPTNIYYDMDSLGMI